MKSRECNPRFVQWVRAFGVARLARSLGVSRNTVRCWTIPEANRRPVVKQADLIVAISGLAQYRPEDGRPLRRGEVLGRAS